MNNYNYTLYALTQQSFQEADAELLLFFLANSELPPPMKNQFHLCMEWGHHHERREGEVEGREGEGGEEGREEEGGGGGGGGGRGERGGEREDEAYLFLHPVLVVVQRVHLELLETAGRVGEKFPHFRTRIRMQQESQPAHATSGIHTVRG